MKNFSQKIQKIECLIEIIKRTNLDNVFNPYTSNCNQHDHSSSHIIRENNLRIYLTKQLQLDPNEFQLTFIGAIEKESELYNIVYNYVRNVDFIQPSSTFLKNHDELSHHSNFTLIS